MVLIERIDNTDIDPELREPRREPRFISGVRSRKENQSPSRQDHVEGSRKGSTFTATNEDGSKRKRIISSSAAQPQDSPSWKVSATESVVYNIRWEDRRFSRANNKGERLLWTYNIDTWYSGLEGLQIGVEFTTRVRCTAFIAASTHSRNIQLTLAYSPIPTRPKSSGSTKT